MKIVRCISCDGYGWETDEFTGEEVECDWCKGIGYVYRDDNQVDHRIPQADWGKVADTLEKLETERMHEMGYTGAAKKPWEQKIREGTRGGMNPNEQQADKND